MHAYWLSIPAGDRPNEDFTYNEQEWRRVMAGIAAHCGVQEGTRPHMFASEWIWWGGVARGYCTNAMVVQSLLVQCGCLLVRSRTRVLLYVCFALFLQFKTPSADLMAFSPLSTTGAPLPIMQLFGVLVRQGQPMIDEHLLTIAEAAIKLVLPQLQR